MTEEQFSQFLLGRGATLDQIHEIEWSLLHEGVKKLLSSKGLPTTAEVIEANLSIIRAKFVESLKIDEAGGIAWNRIKDFL